MTDNNKIDKCYCLEIFRKKYGNHVNGKCLKLACERYRRENKYSAELKSDRQ